MLRIGEMDCLLSIVSDLCIRFILCKNCERSSIGCIFYSIQKDAYICWSDNFEATFREIWMTSFRYVSIQLRSCLWLRNALPTFKVVKGRTEQTGLDGWLWRPFTEWNLCIHKLQSIALRDASFRRTIRWKLLQRAIQPSAFEANIYPLYYNVNASS